MDYLFVSIKYTENNAEIMFGSQFAGADPGGWL